MFSEELAKPGFREIHEQRRQGEEIQALHAELTAIQRAAEAERKASEEGY